MKTIAFMGDSLKRLRAFPEPARRQAGHQLDRVQRGQQPDDFKPLPTIGVGVEEIRIWNEDGTFRVIYTARLQGVVYVLTAFQKTSQATPRSELALAKRRLAQALALYRG
jgi:phage-related protein